MDKLVRKIELPLAKKAIERAGLYIVQKKDIARLAEIAADAYQDYPLHNWFTNGKYDAVASRLIMQISLKTMTDDAIIFADSEEMNGFAVWLPFGFSASRNTGKFDYCKSDHRSAPLPGCRFGSVREGIIRAGFSATGAGGHFTAQIPRCMER